MPAFIDTYLDNRVCPGGLIQSLGDLEGLRYCQSISSGLTINVNDPDADYTSVYDIQSIGGLCIHDGAFSFFYFFQITVISGPLVIQHSNIDSLEYFAQLQSVNSKGIDFFTYSGKQYSLAVLGLNILLLYSQHLYLYHHFYINTEIQIIHDWRTWVHYLLLN